MTIVNGFKSLEQALKDGETTIEIATPKILVACAVTEKCEGIPDNIKHFLAVNG